MFWYFPITQWSQIARRMEQILWNMKHQNTVAYNLSIAFIQNVDSSGILWRQQDKIVLTTKLHICMSQVIAIIEFLLWYLLLTVCLCHS